MEAAGLLPGAGSLVEGAADGPRAAAAADGSLEAVAAGGRPAVAADGPAAAAEAMAVALVVSSLVPIYLL